ncbi:MAG: hypothetical protein M3153_07760 [Chloroflexota bacterium]|nr:hypothetical protein [Chloroflexota bacterium]
MQRLPGSARRAASRLTILVLALTAFGRVRETLRRRRQAVGRHRRAERDVLPSLFDRHPAATSAPRRRIGLRSVPLDRIVGTMRYPSQNTADFLPLPRLRGENWRARWQRITGAMDRLAMLPPVELAQVGEDYYVVDGHNRVAAALQTGGVEVDADVTQLLVAGVTQPGQATLDASSLIGADELRQAAQGRQSRTVERRGAIDEVSRRDLAGDRGEHR